LVISKSPLILGFHPAFSTKKADIRFGMSDSLPPGLRMSGEGQPKSAEGLKDLLKFRAATCHEHLSRVTVVVDFVQGANVFGDKIFEHVRVMGGALSFFLR